MSTAGQGEDRQGVTRRVPATEAAGPWAASSRHRGLTWAVGGLLGSHLHEESHLLALGEGVAGSDPRQPHAKQQPGLPGDGLLLNPLALRTLLLCEAVEETGGHFMPRGPRDPRGLAWRRGAPASHLTAHRERARTGAAAPSRPVVTSGGNRDNSNTSSSASGACPASAPTGRSPRPAARQAVGRPLTGALAHAGQVSVR